MTIEILNMIKDKISDYLIDTDLTLVYRSAEEFRQGWRSGDEEIGIHLFRPNEHDLQDALCVADRDGFQRLIVYI